MLAKIVVCYTNKSNREGVDKSSRIDVWLRDSLEKRLDLGRIVCFLKVVFEESRENNVTIFLAINGSPQTKRARISSENEPGTSGLSGILLIQFYSAFYYPNS